MAGNNLKSRNKVESLTLLGLPTLVLISLLILPLGFLLVLSFWDTVNFEIIRAWKLDNYRAALSGASLRLLAGTVGTALATTALCAVIAYPLAVLLSRMRSNRRYLLLLLIVLPLWTSFLVRTFAWILLLGRNGVVNYGLTQWTPIREPLDFLLYSNFAVLLGLTYVYLPFMVLPLFVVLDGVPDSVYEAARDMGASRLRVFWQVVFPLSIPGLATGSAFVLLPSLGAFITPQLLGGARSLMVGNVIADAFGATFEYPHGAALSFVLMIVMIIFGAVLLRLRTRSGVSAE